MARWAYNFILCFDVNVDIDGALVNVLTRTAVVQHGTVILLVIIHPVVVEQRVEQVT